jgi:hypothetical protein
VPWFPEFNRFTAVTVHDPVRGRVSGDGLTRFVDESAEWLGQRRARTEEIAETEADGRTVLELLAHLTIDGQPLALPVAAVIESTQDTVIRLYYSQWPLTGRHHLRPPLLPAADAHPSGVVGRYHAALDAGDADAIVATYEPDGCFREPSGPQFTVRGTDALREFYTMFFSAGGGIGLQHCTVTDNGVSCALEYNAVRWGRVHLAPQAGVAVYERGASGLIAAARVYDDVSPPMEDA